ncbi:MAG: hypothetical protein ACR2O6_02070 [Ilumatobacteraceae bacterium]
MAALAAAVAVGGLVVGSQFVSADRPTIESVSAAQAQEDTGDESTTEDPADDGGDAPAEDPAGGEASLPGFEEFEAFEQCLDDQLGDVFGGFEAEWNGSVVVENLGGGGEESFSLYDFGAGDGSVTVTKTGDTITVETSGDVAELDESTFEGAEAEFEAAEQACADLLPEDVKVFGDKIDVWLDGGEFPIDEAMIDDLKQMFPIDEAMIAEFKEMFEDGEFPMLDEFFENGEFPMLDEFFENGEFPMFDEFHDMVEGESGEGSDDSTTDDQVEENEPAGSTSD